MTTEKFLEELRLILGSSTGVLTPEMRLADYPGWDSMGKMAALTLIDSDVGVSVPAGMIEKWKTVGELMEFVGPYLKKL